MKSVITKNKSKAYIIVLLIQEKKHHGMWKLKSVFGYSQKESTM